MSDDGNIIDMTSFLKAISNHEQQHKDIEKRLQSLNCDILGIRERMNFLMAVHRENAKDLIDLDKRCTHLENLNEATPRRVVKVNVLAVCNLLGMVPCAFCEVGNLGVSIEPCKSCSIYQKVLMGELPSNFVLKEELRCY